MPSRARLMASSATRWVRWRIKVKAHVLALICPFTARCSGCGIAIGAWQPGLQAEEGQQRYTSRTTPDVTCVTRHAQNAKPTSRCRTVAPWSTTMRRVFHPETNGVKACPHRHKRVLSHGAPADPSDPWNSHPAPVSPRQNGDSEFSGGLVSYTYLRVHYFERAAVFIDKILEGANPAEL